MAIAPSTMLALQSAVGGCGMGERGDVADRHEGASALPGNPIAAVTHPDPYPCYADLVATTPLYRDDTLGLWVATSAEVVLAVLTSDLCRVRPAAEPVPKALLGSPAVDIFRHLVRMNDGADHCPFKQAVSAALGSIDATRAARQASHWAQRLSDELTPHIDRKSLADLAFRLPAYVVASLLGIPDAELRQTALWIDDFVRCLAPSSTSEQIERGKIAARHLLDLAGSLLADPVALPADGLLAALAREAKRVGRDDANIIVTNGIGFLSQAYEATAGLIGNSVLALARHSDVREEVRAQPSLLRNLVAEVSRYDPPVQNTRRFLVRAGSVAGQQMNEGDAVLVVLAAASRDPAANPNPDRFDLFRTNRRAFTFGSGAHACPGEALAMTIAQAGVAQLLRSGIELEQLAGAPVYRASANVRIPLLGTRPPA